MPEQLLPRVKQEIFNGMTASLAAGLQVDDWIATLARENPQILMGVDAFGKPGALLIAAYVYALLNSQAEADRMREDFQ
jgi:hypothetical protein